MKRIPLADGRRFAIVDDRDFVWLRKSSWFYSKGYALRHTRRDGRDTTETMQSVIIRPAPGLIADHINGDGLDNRRTNLREATRSQNGRNAAASGTTSRFKGVSFIKGAGRYRAAIQTNGDRRHLGYFNREINAALAYDAAAREIHGRYACLNFPWPGERSAHRPNKEERHALAVRSA